MWEVSLELAKLTEFPALASFTDDCKEGKLRVFSSDTSAVIEVTKSAVSEW